MHLSKEFFWQYYTLKLYNLYLYMSISKGWYILRRAKKPYKMVDVIYGRPQRDNSFCPMVLSLATNKLSEINPNIAGHFQIKRPKKVFFNVRFFFFLFQSNICGQIHGNKQHKKIITVLLCVYKIKLQRVHVIRNIIVFVIKGTFILMLIEVELCLK